MVEMDPWPDPPMQDSTSAGEAAPSPASTWVRRAMLNWVTRSRASSLCMQALIIFLRGIPLISLAIVGHRSWRLFRLVRRLNRSFFFVVARSTLEFMALLEISFFLYYSWRKQILEARRSYQPFVLWKAPGERKKLLMSFWGNIDKLHQGSLELGGRSHIPKLDLTKRTGGPRVLRDVFMPVATSAAAAPEAEVSKRGEVRQSKPRRLRSSSKPALSRMMSQPSVENLLRLADEDGGANGGDQLDERDAPTCLKHLELCTWFRHLGKNEICSDVREIWRGNIEEWVASYWFDGAESIEELTEPEKEELDELVREVLKQVNLPLQADRGSVRWQGRNANLRCFRIASDPFAVVHRPLVAYMFTALILPYFGGKRLHSWGFRPFRSGSTEYWYRTPSRNDVELPNRPRLDKTDRLPLIFFHGIGFGNAMCLSFVKRLLRGIAQDYPIFLVDTAVVSMRFSEVAPCAREVAANVVNMLEVWGFKQAHFVGHSFGTFIVAWLWRYQRGYIQKCTFLDPVCFLVLKGLAEGHELQQVRWIFRMNFMEMVLKFFALTELFTVNYVCRCFNWEESQLNLESMQGSEILVVLEAEDALVPTHSVHRLIYAERRRRAEEAPSADSEHGLGVMWVEGQPHGGFLIDAPTCEEVCKRISDFHARPFPFTA